MTRGLRLDHVRDVEPFFISRTLIIPGRSKYGNVLRKNASFRDSVYLLTLNELGSILR